MKEYQNFLFDLYGTLADIRTEEDSLAFWTNCCRLLAMQGARYTPGELRAKFHDAVKTGEAAAREALGPGREPEIDFAPIFRSFFEDKGVPADDRTTADFARSFRVFMLKRLKLYPGVPGLLKTLHRAGKKIYLLSNAQSLFTRPELTLLGLDGCFDGSVLSSEVGLKKPDAGFYRYLLEKYDLDPRVTVMIGNDDIADCHGAAGAGLDSCYVPTAISPAQRGPLPENCRILSKIADAAMLLAEKE